MQLPRGSFHSIKRGIVLNSLLDEMERSGFSGYCTISYDAVNCTLVLHSGDYILAEYGKTEGDQAWVKILELQSKKVDAALTGLTEAQLKLSIEFNPHAELLEPVKRVRPHAVKTTPPQVRSEAIGKSETRHARTPESRGPHQVHAATSGVKPQETIQKRRSGENDELEMLTRDLGSLDDMNLDEMTKKIRENCMVTVQKLRLDHLIEKTS